MTDVILLMGALVCLTVCAPLIILDGERVGRRLARRQRLSERRTAVLAARAERAVEDQAWAARREQAAREAILYALVAQNIRTVDDLARSLDVGRGLHSVKVPVRLEVVR